jgi:multisubunit Na+/H+ antiporter MnhB subunit
MIYIFGATAIYTLIKQKNKLLEEKRNLVLYLILSVMGLALGIIYLLNPYIPSLSMYMEKYFK